MTDDKHLVEEMLGREDLLQGSFFKAVRDTVRLPDGHTSTREYVIHPGAVVVVPLLDDGRVVLERQYRYPVGQVMIEFPAGKLDPGEDPLACGQRELLEEFERESSQNTHPETAGFFGRVKDFLGGLGGTA